MARQLANSGVYPPRYFVGFVELHPHGSKTPVRINFRNAPLLPMTDYYALLFPGARDSAFYSALDHARRFPAGRLLAIQYAISVYDARQGCHVIEKFRHPFGPHTTIKRQQNAIVIEAHDGKLFVVQRVDNTLTGITGSAVPVVQFSS